MNMKKLTITLLAAGAMFTASAAELKWLTDAAKAQAQAKAENKLVLLDFTGSDWCPPCIKMRKEVFSKKEYRLSSFSTAATFYTIKFSTDTIL